MKRISLVLCVAQGAAEGTASQFSDHEDGRPSEERRIRREVGPPTFEYTLQFLRHQQPTLRAQGLSVRHGTEVQYSVGHAAIHKPGHPTRYCTPRRIPSAQRAGRFRLCSGGPVALPPPLGVLCCHAYTSRTPPLCKTDQQRTSRSTDSHTYEHPQRSRPLAVLCTAIDTPTLPHTHTTCVGAQRQIDWFAKRDYTNPKK